MKKMSKKELRLVTGGGTGTNPIAQYCLNPNTHTKCLYNNDGDLVGAIPSICVGFCIK